MRLKLILSTGLFAAVTALSMGVKADEDMDKATEANAQAAGMQTDQKMKSHSHAEEKSEVPQKAPEVMSDKPDPAKDKKRHLHPRARSRFGALAFPVFP